MRAREQLGRTKLARDLSRKLITRERERERERYIYIYIYMYMCRWRERERAYVSWSFKLFLGALKTVYIEHMAHGVYIHAM